MIQEQGARLEGVRKANLGSVLRLAHHHGPLSRAELTARTGLNRSTIADLVSTLVSEGLLNEGNPIPTRRVGRPSPSVSPSSTVAAISLNPEVDSIEIAAVGLGGNVLARRREVTKTVPTPAETIATAERVIADWRSAELTSVRIVGVGVAVPGLVRESDAVVRLAPHLGWREVEFGAQLSERLGLPVAVGNDASYGALAEWLFGAAQGYEHVVYLNGGPSGIGGGLILHGRPIRGAGGYAGEWGKNAPTVNAPVDNRSGTVLEDEVNRRRLTELVGLTAPDDIELAEALDRDDTRVAAEIRRQQHLLAGALANAINTLNPAIIVLGGFLAILHRADPERLEGYITELALPVPAEDVTIAAAALGTDRLLIGAAEMVFTDLFADPLANLGVGARADAETASRS